MRPHENSETSSQWYWSLVTVILSFFLCLWDSFFGVLNCIIYYVLLWWHVSKAQETYIIDATEGGNALATETLTKVPKSIVHMLHSFVNVCFLVSASAFFHPSNPTGSSNDLGWWPDQPKQHWNIGAHLWHGSCVPGSLHGVQTC